MPRPNKELNAFAKVHLASGERRQVTLELTAPDFAFFDVASKGWLVEQGTFSLMVGTSATDIRFTERVSRQAPINLPT